VTVDFVWHFGFGLRVLVDHWGLVHGEVVARFTDSRIYKCQTGNFGVQNGSLEILSCSISQVKELLYICPDVLENTNHC
jgi:hypothetical protein